MPVDELESSTQSESIDLIRIWRITWANKWIIASVAMLFAALAGGYATLSNKWYRSDVLLAPSSEQSGTGLQDRLGGLGGLAGLAGISLGGKSIDEHVAILGSRDFSRAFIEEKNLLPVLFADHWDSEKGEWREEDEENRPDIRDGVNFFLQEVLTVSVGKSTNLVTLRVEWTDAELAANWAMELVSRVNDSLRERALKEAERNITFLRAELEQTNIAPMRQSIGNLLEGELQTLMLAKGTEEYAFRVLDGAQVAKKPIRPQVFLLVAGALILGGTFAVFVVLAHDTISRQLRAGK